MNDKNKLKCNSKRIIRSNIHRNIIRSLSRVVESRGRNVRNSDRNPNAMPCDGKRPCELLLVSVGRPISARVGRRDENM